MTFSEMDLARIAAADVMHTTRALTMMLASRQLLPEPTAQHVADALDAALEELENPPQATAGDLFARVGDVRIIE